MITSFWRRKLRKLRPIQNDYANVLGVSTYLTSSLQNCKIWPTISKRFPTLYSDTAVIQGSFLEFSSKEKKRTASFPKVQHNDEGNCRSERPCRSLKRQFQYSNFGSTVSRYLVLWHGLIVKSLNRFFQKDKKSYDSFPA